MKFMNYRTLEGEKMINEKGRDSILVIWKDPEKRTQYVIGEILKNGKYEFSYGYDVKEAIKNGFELLISFNDLNKTYYSEKLFPSFANRLPHKKRRGIEKILKRYDLDQFDEYELLKRCGAKLPTDNLEFIDPIPSDLEEDKIIRYFFVAGARHYIGCEGNLCENTIEINEKQELKLVRDNNNEYDKFAVRIYDLNDNHIGYIPRYYSENISKLLQNNYNYKLTTHIVNKNNDCNECIKVKLEFFK